jgi:IS605 OrfB family transposase
LKESIKLKFLKINLWFQLLLKRKYPNILGIDLNCGVGRSIANCANLKNGEVLNLGKQGPNIRKSYFTKRKTHRISSDKEKRKTRDLDHKISRTIVNYALKHKLKIVVEDLSGIRKTSSKGNGSKEKNRFVNSWSFYRLQQFIEYKAKEHGIPFEKINPQYTSQECNYCSVLGERLEVLWYFYIKLYIFTYSLIYTLPELLLMLLNFQLSFFTLKFHCSWNDCKARFIPCLA